MSTLPVWPGVCQGHVFVNQYLIIKDIGRGMHGTVKLVYNTQDEMMYACKVRGWLGGWVVGGVRVVGGGWLVGGRGCLRGRRWWLSHRHLHE